MENRSITSKGEPFHSSGRGVENTDKKESEQLTKSMTEPQRIMRGRDNAGRGRGGVSEIVGLPKARYLKSADQRNGDKGGGFPENIQGIYNLNRLTPHE